MILVSAVLNILTFRGLIELVRCLLVLKVSSGTPKRSNVPRSIKSVSLGKCITSITRVAWLCAKSIPLIVKNMILAHVLLNVLTTINNRESASLPTALSDISGIHN